MQPQPWDPGATGSQEGWEEFPPGPHQSLQREPGPCCLALGPLASRAVRIGVCYLTTPDFGILVTAAPENEYRDPTRAETLLASLAARGEMLMHAIQQRLWEVLRGKAGSILPS